MSPESIRFTSVVASASAGYSLALNSFRSLANSKRYSSSLAEPMAIVQKRAKSLSVLLPHPSARLVGTEELQRRTSMACATVTCRRCSMPPNLLPKQKHAGALPLSAANSAYFALTALSTNYPTPIVIRSLPRDGYSSTRSSRLNAPPVSNLLLSPPRIFAGQKEIKI